MFSLFGGSTRRRSRGGKRSRRGGSTKRRTYRGGQCPFAEIGGRKRGKRRKGIMTHDRKLLHGGKRTRSRNQKGGMTSQLVPLALLAGVLGLSGKKRKCSKSKKRKLRA